MARRLRLTHENEIGNPGFSQPSTFLEGLTQETGEDDTLLDRLHPGTPSGPELLCACLCVMRGQEGEITADNDTLILVLKDPLWSFSLRQTWTGIWLDFQETLNPSPKVLHQTWPWLRGTIAVGRGVLG